jgi:hypothetical protein
MGFLQRIFFTGSGPRKSFFPHNLQIIPTNYSEIPMIRDAKNEFSHTYTPQSKNIK